jgi:hypothetical protein
LRGALLGHVSARFGFTESCSSWLSAGIECGQRRGGRGADLGRDLPGVAFHLRGRSVKVPDIGSTAAPIVIAVVSNGDDVRGPAVSGPRPSSCVWERRRARRGRVRGVAQIWAVVSRLSQSGARVRHRGYNDPQGDSRRCAAWLP